ncbi:type 4 prepilin-like proteins leader peptide processing enzyme [Lactiplantibacillus plantarum]|nr:type 4 prepilin-like proteins leader peptide processing enzyme [Lactiplantibacillus plantarum]
MVATSPGPLTTALPLIIGYLVLIFNSLTDYLNYDVYPLTLITPAVLGLWQQRPNLDIGFYILLVLIVTLYLLAHLTPTFGLGDVDVLLMLGCLATANAILTSLALASTAALVFFILGSSKRRLPFVPFISWGFILVTQLVGPT